MRKLHLLLLIMLLSLSSWSQSRKIHFGLEQDVLPYLLKGYFLSAWTGQAHFRFRASYAEAENPEFIRQEGISFDRVRALGISIEYFLKEDYKGFWIGPGLGYWENTVRDPGGDEIKLEGMIFSIGGGWVFPIWKGLYFTPWLALHTRIEKAGQVPVGTAVYKPLKFTPEASLKLGWHFRLRPYESLPPVTE